MPQRLTPAQRRLQAQVAAHTRWAHEPDREAAMLPALNGMLAKFEKQVDPDGILPPHIRAERAASAKTAYYRGLALRSSKVRAARRGIAATAVVA